MSQSAARGTLTGRPLPVQAPTAFVRVRPRRASAGSEARLSELPCSYASVPAAVGSRSPRPSSPPSGCGGPGIEIALVPITTAGDRDRTKPFGEIGSRGVFVKELEEALLDGRIDVAVHSAKDMTSTDVEGLAVGAYLEREDPRDALCGADGASAGHADRTASVRRRAQLLALEPTLSIEPLRGNIDTRLRKRGERGLDAVVLAACGLDRLGLATRSGSASSRRSCCPRRARARSRLQVRAGEEELVASVDHAETRRRVEAERRCVAAVGGGCLAPVAAHHDGTTLTGLIAAEDGSWVRRLTGDDPTPSVASSASIIKVKRMKVIVTRPREQAGPLVARLEALGHEVVECPLIEIERTSDEPIDAAGYDWVIVTSPNGADEIAGAGAACRSSPRSGRARPSDCASTGSSRRSFRASRRRTGCSPSFRVRPAACSSRRRRTRGGARSTRSAPTSCRSTDAAAHPRAAGRRRRRARVRLGRARMRRSAGARRRCRSGPRRRASPSRSASRSPPRPRPTTSTASSRPSAL